MTCTYCCVYSTPGDGQKTRPKHVQFYSKNKFEKLVHIFGIIILRIYHDAQSCECQKLLFMSCGYFARYLLILHSYRYTVHFHLCLFLAH